MVAVKRKAKVEKKKTVKKAVKKVAIVKTKKSVKKSKKGWGRSYGY